VRAVAWLSGGRPSLENVSTWTDAQIIDAFMGRASRVINSKLVDATTAQIEAGYSFNVRMIKGGGYEVSYHGHDEYYVKGLATDLRPFLPWVDDTVKITRVIRAVLNSLTDQQFKNTLLQIQQEYKDQLTTQMFSSHWSIPSRQWQMSMTDIELARTVLNAQWFHEGMDPQMRDLLQSEAQAGGNYRAVWRLLNNTIVIVALVQRFIIEADDAKVLHPKTK
jgi:hypothetical protein